MYDVYWFMVYTGLWIFVNVYGRSQAYPKTRWKSPWLAITGHNWPLVWSPAGGSRKSASQSASGEQKVWIWTSDLCHRKGTCVIPWRGIAQVKNIHSFEPLLGGCPREGGVLARSGGGGKMHFGGRRGMREVLLSPSFPPPPPPPSPHSFPKTPP